MRVPFQAKRLFGLVTGGFEMDMRPPLPCGLTRATCGVTRILIGFALSFSSMSFAQSDSQNAESAMKNGNSRENRFGVIRQTTALFPASRAQMPRFARPSPLFEQASAGFSLLPAMKEGITFQPKRYEVNFSSAAEANAVRPICGPAPDLNSFACFNLGTGESLADIPLPGQLSTQPQYFEGSWYVGTTRGFFIRYETTGVYLTPGFGIDSSLFHGPDARLAMKLLASVGSSGGAASPTDGNTPVARPRFRGAWSWSANANAEFIGTPQFGGGRVFVLTANQSLNAYELDSGKLLWGVRLAPDVQLRLASTSLLLHERGLIAGTSDGHVVLLDPKNGQTIWRQSLNVGGTNDRFSSVAAPVLTLPEGVIASNAESVTQRLTWDARATEWSYKVGSVVQPKSDDGSLFIAGSDGALHKLDARTGQLIWRTTLPVTSPLIALTLLKKQGTAIAATAHGALFVVNMKTGKLMAASDASTYGPILGDFFAGRSEVGEVCLSYRTPGFACWAWEPEKRSLRHDR